MHEYTLHPECTATHCSILQRSALQCVHGVSVHFLRYDAVCCSVLQCVAVRSCVDMELKLYTRTEMRRYILHALQHTAAYCNTMQHSWGIYTPREMYEYTLHALQHTVAYCSTLQHIAAHCSTLQRTATHCNTLYVKTYTLQ